MDVPAILEKLSEYQFVRLNRPINGWYSIYCPFHNDGNERRASCGISLHDEYRNGQHYPQGFCHCFTCGAAYTMEEFVTELLKRHHIDRSGRDWLVENVPGFSVEDIEFEYLLPKDLLDQAIGNFAVSRLQQMENPVKYVSEEELASYRFTVPYMYERKLTDEIIEEYDIGFDVNWIPPGRKKPVPCITFPVRDKYGRTLFFCRRSVEGKLYNYPEGVTKPVYGIDRVQPGKPVVICESCINALTARVYGYQAVALLGTGNSYQIQQLKELGVEEFVICTDGDDAGRRAARKLQKALSSCSIVWTVEMPDGKDLNDLTKEEFDELYKNRS